MPVLVWGVGFQDWDNPCVFWGGLGLCPSQKGTKYGRFRADSMFSGPWAAWFKLKLKKEKTGFNPKKAQDFENVSAEDIGHG